MSHLEGGTVFQPDASPAKERLGKSVLNHVLIIPDNNRTWAREHGLTVQQGYDEGAKRIVEAGHSALAVPDLDYLTVHLVSQDNIVKRPKSELSVLWNAVQKNMIDTGLPQLVTDRNVRFRVLGDMSGIDEDVKNGFNALTEQSRDNTGLSLSFVVGYDKDQEMQHALTRAKLAGEDTADWNSVKQHLYLPEAGMPDVSAIIRAGDEKRTSGIFPHSSASAEHLYQESAKWPEFTSDVFYGAVELLAQRKVKGGA